MMSIELAKQRRDELLREAERNHQAKVLRAARRLRADRRSGLVWEIKRYAGRLFKLLRTMMNTG
jgi:hypothetical protein